MITKRPGALRSTTVVTGTHWPWMFTLASASLVVRLASSFTVQWKLRGATEASDATAQS